jgi:LemA family
VTWDATEALCSIPLEELKTATSVASSVLELGWGSRTAQAITVLIVVLVLAVLVLIGFVMGYNKIRGADVRVAEALSGIDVELTRRASLIPSLVQTVQTFAADEKGILDHVTNARVALTSATTGKSVAQRIAAEKELDTALAPAVLQRLGGHVEPADHHDPVDVRRAHDRGVGARVLPDTAVTRALHPSPGSVGDSCATHL